LRQNICKRIIQNFEDEMLFNIFSKTELLTKFEFACAEVEKKEHGSELFWNYSHDDIGYFESSKYKFKAYAAKLIPKFTAICSISNEAQADQTQTNEVAYNVQEGYKSFILLKKRNASSKQNHACF